MNRRLLPFILFAIMVEAQATAIEVPQLRRYVTDLAGVMSTGERDRLEQKLQSYDQATSSQFVVLIIPSLEGESLEDYSLQVAEKNQIGRKGKDNGLLLLVSITDRKLRFEVGYGLEGVLTDAMTSEIIRSVIVPEFRAGRFSEGIERGMDTAIRAAAGEFTAPPRKERDEKEGRKIGPIIIMLIIFFLAFRRKKGRRYFPGGFWYFGGFGGGGGGFGGGSFGGGGFSGGGGGFGGGGSSGSW